MAQSIGIDLGTTFSAAAIVDHDGRATMLKNSDGKTITPSVIYFGGNTPLIGDEAKEMQALGETDIASFFKRSMGDPGFILEFNGKNYTPTDLSAIILTKIKADAQRALNDTVTHAVITVPAYFNNLQREATIEAGKMAGLEVLRIINEPTAAALAYGLARRERKQTLLVYDLGGGTFDITIVGIQKKTITVIATDGDHNLGGKDWDDRIAAFLGQQFHQQHGVNPLDDAESFQDLMIRTENAKKQLSKRDTVKISIIHHGQRESYSLSRDQFEEITADLMERTRQLCRQVLKDAGMNWADIDGVLLVGGSTRMPMVRRFVTHMCGKKPLTGINVDEAVAMGAAIQAHLDTADLKTNSSRSTFTLKGRIKTQDVMSHSLGLVAKNKERTHYINSTILPKNTPIPNSISKPFQLRTFPSQDNHLDVYILQGESQDPVQCVVLGKYVFSGITHDQQWDAHIDVTYSHNTSGVLTVSAVEKSTGKALPLHIETDPGDLSWLKEEIKEDDSPYNNHAGRHGIPGAVRDKYGNPDGNQYDLVKDNAFLNHTIAVLHLCATGGFDFQLPEAALREKGFDVHLWTDVPSTRKFQQILDNACQFWLISSDSQMLSHKYVRIIKKFFLSGKGIYLWGDNDPWYADANLVLKTLFGCRMSGYFNGDQVLTKRKTPGKRGFSSHLITTGLDYLYEGITVAKIDAHPDLAPLMNGSDDQPLVSVYEKNQCRAIIDGGFTRLYCNWDTAGTGRYVKNVAGWLVNHERFANK